MPRGDRYLVLAVIGCLTAAVILGWLLQPKQPYFSGDRGYAEQSASYQAGGSQCQPAAIQRLPVRNRQSKRDACDEAQEQHREATDSLIQARRSADAADASAVAAFKQAGIAAWGTAIGLLTLFAAGFAAWYAREAARHTQAGARAADEANRAWVDVSASINKELPLTWTDKDCGIHVLLGATHYGTSPAFRVEVGGFVVSSDENLKPRIDELVEEGKKKAWFPATLFNSTPFNPMPWLLNFDANDPLAVEHGMMRPFLIAYAFYDINGSTSRKATVRVYELTRQDGRLIVKDECPIPGKVLRLRQTLNQPGYVS